MGRVLKAPYLFVITMIIKKGDVELLIKDEDYPKYKKVGWVSKHIRNPKNTRKHYLKRKEKQKGSE